MLSYIIILMYNFYNWMCYLIWICRRHNVPYYYLVDNEGNQHTLTNNNLAMYDVLLVIYRTSKSVRYRFQPITMTFENVSQIKTFFSDFSEPDLYKLFAVNFTIDDKPYTVNTIEFNVVGNVIFTRTFKKWLCRYYLNIPKTADFDITYIDDDMNIVQTSGSMSLMQRNLEIQDDDKKNS